MTPITTFPQLLENLETMRLLLESSQEAERSFALGLVRNGISFVVIDLKGTTLFAPSRFVGYQENTFERHRDSDLKDGRETSRALEALLEGAPLHDSRLENEYFAYCRRLGIEVREKAPFGVARKFWDLRAHAQSELSQGRVLWDFSKELSQARRRSSEERRARLETAPKRPGSSLSWTRTFHRNADVVEEVLFRANGHCEACGQPAPFLRASDGSPYLEVHHKTPLADGGEDTVENAIALCPNCHRKAHFG